MSRIRIYPYKMGSKGAKQLSHTLDVLRVRPDGRFRPRRNDVIINWGNSIVPDWSDSRHMYHWLNHPALVGLASNKLTCFEMLSLKDVPTLEWTDDWLTASSWEHKTYVRNKLTGHSGEGIEIVEAGEGLPRAPLYTKAKENHGEYRVHVFKGEIIDYRKKSRKDGDHADESQSEIRTLGNGWVFRQSNLRQLDRIKELAIQAIEALGLDFGAVDIIKDENGDVFVVEVNTAVAMDETTLANYLTAINNFYESI